MTYTPSFLIKASFFRYFVNALCSILKCCLGGAVIGTVFCHLFAERAIWMALIPLGALLCVFLYADLAAEKDMKEKKPAGH